MARAVVVLLARGLYGYIVSRAPPMPVKQKQKGSPYARVSRMARYFLGGAKEANVCSRLQISNVSRKAPKSQVMVQQGKVRGVGQKKYINFLQNLCYHMLWHAVLY